VFAVRQGPPLTRNLRLSVTGAKLATYHPQRHWLALISTGDQFAVASHGWLGFGGRWVWRWKDWIDRRFMHKFQDLALMPMASNAQSTTASDAGAVQLTQEESLQAISAIAMRCGGCGAKVGASVLSRALAQLQAPDRPDVLVGLKHPDDAAIVRVPAGKAIVQTVDFFRAFIDDPYLFGKIAANHALGDIWAMGAEAQSATAIVTIPPGLEAKMEEVLFQMMSGAIEVLNAADCALVGGHTGEGRELALGFAINGLIDDYPDHSTESSPESSPPMRKSGMQAGDVLILTKPIGTGTLFAAHAQLVAKGRWIDAALQSMQISNRQGAKILRQFAASACTDLTGFGLLGHLLEMTRASGVDAEISLSALPLLAGAQECVAAGIVSSLQAANVRLRRALRNQEQMVQHARYPLLFDPQTAGGLLASVPAAQADSCIAALRAQGYEQSAIIGRVLAQGDALEPIFVCG
jgi:selenide,water dikinase